MWLGLLSGTAFCGDESLGLPQVVVDLDPSGGSTDDPANPAKEPTMSEFSTSPAGGLSLNELLGILWRRKSLVFVCTLAGLAAGIAYGLIVTPLHRATLTIQPGITSFNTEGNPIREWRIQDIELWFRRGDFNPRLAYSMGQDASRFRPVIFATSIPRGPQSQGGNTITLSTLDPSPEQAAKILEGSVDVFNDFASSDTLRSNLGLMRARLQTDGSKHQARLDQLAAEHERIELQIAAAKADRASAVANKSVVEQKIGELEGLLETLALSVEAYEQALSSTNVSSDSLSKDVDRWKAQSDELMKRRDSLLGQTGDPTALLLVSQAVGDLVRDVGAIRLGLLEHAAQRLVWQDRLQTLRRQERETESLLSEKRFELEQLLPRRILEHEQKAADLALRRDYDLKQQRAELTQELRAIQSRIDSLSPLERVGSSSASARPVRPRKLRAMIILTSLAFVGSVFLAFTLEYLSRNWSEITRGPRGA